MRKTKLAPTIDEIKTALRMEGFDSGTAQMKMAPRMSDRAFTTEDRHARQAAVLILLYPHETQLHFMLTRRSESLAKHSGQISLPGGSCDPQDRDTGETAIREAYEEIAVIPADVMLIGELSALYIPNSNFQVFPHIGFIPYHPHFIPSEAEVAELIEVPLALLLDEDSKRSDPWKLRTGTYEIPYYQFGDHKIWGATAMMLSEFEGRLKASLQGSAR